MRVLAAAVAAALSLALLLTWLLLRSLEQSDNRMQHAIDAVALNEAMIYRDVLRARAGLLMDYDPLVVEMAALERSRTELDAVALGRAPAQRAALAALLLRQDSLIEQFKSDNALLQNALAYLDTLSGRLGDNEADPVLSAKIRAIVTAMLHLTRDSSPERAAFLASTLDSLAAQTRPRSVRDSASAADATMADRRSLLLHGRLLLGLLPGVDNLLHELFVAAGEKTLVAMRHEVEVTRLAAVRRAARYRLALYLIALLLLALLVRVGLRLRARSAALRERMRLEQVITDVSTRFMACPADEIDAHLDQALAELGVGFAADRAYVTLAGPPARTRLWSRDGVERRAGWPELAPDLLSSPRAGLPAGDDLIVREAGLLPQGKLKSALEAAGVSGWAAAKLVRQDCALGLFGFDTIAPTRSWSGDLGLLRMAADVVANALQRQHAAGDRIALEMRLRRAQRLEVVGTFASGIAHNFNNLVGIVLGHAEMAAEGLAPRQPQGRHVQEIMRAGERARDLVAKILDFGRMGGSERKAVAIDALMAETASMLPALLPPGITLSITGAAPDTCVLGEPAQLQQVLVNLVRNAAQACGGAGRIEIAVDMQHLETGVALSHGTVGRGSHVRLRVTDRGHGMDAATIARLFEPFFTTRPAGTGLGLATTREIVQDGGGAMDIRSMPGQGSVFEVWLPATRCSDRAAVPLLGGGEVVMVTGAEASSVQQDEEMLAALGYEPVGFTSAVAALEAARSASERFDLLMVDAEMPRIGGLELASRLHQLLPGRPVILTTHLAGELQAARLAQAGITEVLPRPWRSATLARTVEGCLAQAMARRETSSVLEHDRLDHAPLD